LNNKPLSLQKIINLEKWQEVQDKLALVTEMAMITVDYKGIPVTKHSYCREFCQFIRNNPSTSKYCRKCDSRGGLEAVRLNEPYIYLCHCNIIDIAIPIVVNENYIGAIMAGQVLVAEKEEEERLERILSPANSDAFIKTYNLNDYHKRLPVLSFGRIKLIANMLFNLVNYLVEEAINKNTLLNMYEKLLKKAGSLSNSSDFSDYLPLELMKNMKNRIDSAITQTQINSYNETVKIPENSILKPAIEYIFNNKSENITLNQMARLCHVSPSYFSRLFSKEMGENFSDYLPRLKVEWAKKLLETTDSTISQISSDLGFCDDGYFIKVFKKFEGVTPAIYRKHLA
jgi:ligand-binding sensor protein/AraC-like DNA-binding protein